MAGRKRLLPNLMGEKVSWELTSIVQNRCAIARAHPQQLRDSCLIGGGAEGGASSRFLRVKKTAAIRVPVKGIVM